MTSLRGACWPLSQAERVAELGGGVAEVAFPAAALPPRAGLAQGDPLEAGVRLPGGGVLLDIRVTDDVTTAEQLAAAAAGSWTTAGLRSMRSTRGVNRSTAEADGLSSEAQLLDSCRSSKHSLTSLPPPPPLTSEAAV